MSKEEEMHISDIIEDVKIKICSKYCRFTEAYDDEERLIEEKCSHCPLIELS